jgi:hypothetical protein
MGREPTIAIAQSGGTVLRLRVNRQTFTKLMTELLSRES